jgi:serine/threonine-protein kinase RsbW
MAASRLVITSDSAELVRVRAWLRDQLSDIGLAPREQSGLQVAVGELTSNSIKHAYGGQAGQPIHISVESRGDSVVIEIEDFGAPFDPARYQDPNLDQANEGGMGLYIVRRLADELRFDLARERGTRWTLVKYWDTQPQRSA